MAISVKSLIFDYGGTIDTNGIHWSEVIWQAYDNVGAPVSREAFREAYVHVERTLGDQILIQPGHTFRDVLEIKIKMQFESLGIKDMLLVKKISESCYDKTTHVIGHALETLDKLHTRYPMILVSNFYGNLRTVLNEFCLANYFSEIIESAEVGVRKPNPDIYKIGIEKLGLCPEDIVIIGDSYKNDIKPASILGCQSIWLKGKGWDNKDESIEHPNIIKDFAELNKLLP